MSPQELQRRLIRFGVSVCKHLRSVRRDFVVDHFASQLLRSATSPSAIYAEARDAESRRDFIHKMKIGLKELRESDVWLEYVAALTPDSDRNAILIRECNELTAMFVASIKTARE